MKLWLNREALNSIENFGAYLNRMSRNHCLNAIKRLPQESRISLEISRTGSELSYETEDGIAYRDTKERLEKAIAALTPQQQRVYRLCHIEGLKYEEAASELNISPGTVHTHMKQALKLIRSRLQDAGSVLIVLELVHTLDNSNLF